MLSWTRSLSPLAFLLLLVAPSTTYAIEGGHDPEPDDRRFDAVAAFSISAWIGLDDPDGYHHNWFCTATLISETQIVTAKHCWPNNGTRMPSPGEYGVRFRRHVDGSLGSVGAGVRSFHNVRVSSWMAAPDFADIVLGTLEVPVTHITPIPPMLTMPPPGHVTSGTAMINAGWGNEGPGGPRTRLRLCNNRFTYTGVSYYYFHGRSTNPSGCGVILHDSGSPMLIEDPISHSLRTVGVVSTGGGGPSLHPYAGHATFVIPDAPIDPFWLALYDAGVDAGRDAGTDAGYDAGYDAGTGAGDEDAGEEDAGSDAGFDAGERPRLDGGAGVEIDAGESPGTDAGNTTRDAGIALDASRGGGGPPPLAEEGCSATPGRTRPAIGASAWLLLIPIAACLRARWRRARRTSCAM